MLELWIADLKSDELKFSVPSTIGTWEFHRRDDYETLVSRIQEGQCASTYYAYNESITIPTSNQDFVKAIDDLIDACLILSFVTATCVTPKGSTPQSEVQFMQLGDSFIRPRAIAGFDPLPIGKSFDNYFSKGMSSLDTPFKERRFRLFLSHWISGLTCFSLEDLFLSIGVQMDIVKQCEIAIAGRDLTYYEGMKEASLRYSLQPLSADYKNMRNDIVHEGVLSGTNFKNRTKEQCAEVVAASLNWIDDYVSAVLSFSPSQQRWKPKDLETMLPALSLNA
jgi:hypothetical protein